MVVWYQTIKNNYKTLLLSFFSIFLYNKSKNNLLWLFFIVWYQTTVMISINVIIFCNNMFCEVYKSHPWRHGYPPSGPRVPEAGIKKIRVKAEKRLYKLDRLFDRPRVLPVTENMKLWQCKRFQIRLLFEHLFA